MGGRNIAISLPSTNLLFLGQGDSAAVRYNRLGGLPRAMNTGPPSPLNVSVIMSAIRQRMRSENQREAAALRNARKSLPADLVARVSRLQARMGSLRASVAHIGGMPPAPPTLRGRLGALAVGGMRRSLFWLIPNLQATQEQLIAAIDDQTKALEEVVTALQKTNFRIELLNGERESAGAAVDDGRRDAAGSWERPH
jgi:hypothetical protein